MIYCERCLKVCSGDIESCHTCTPQGAWRKGMDEGYKNGYRDGYDKAIQDCALGLKQGKSDE